MRSFTNELCGFGQIIWWRPTATLDVRLQTLLKIIYKLDILGIVFVQTIECPLQRRGLSKECIHCEGPLYQRYSILCTSLDSVITTTTSSSFCPPSLCFHGRQGSFSLPRAVLFVCLIVGKFLDCPWESPALWTGFSLGVLQARRGWAPALLWLPPSNF